jgi:hypothetical protein
MITLRNFRIHDPSRPSLLNDNWLRFDAESLMLDVDFETDQTAPFRATAYIEQQLLVSSPFEIVATSAIVDTQSAAASLPFDPFPTLRRQERPTSNQSAFGFAGTVPFLFRYRFRVAVQNQAESVGEVIIPFAVDYLPVVVGFVHVYDPAAPTPVPRRPEHQRVPNVPSALVVAVRFQTELTEVACTVSLHDRGAFDALIASQTRTFIPNGAIHAEFVWNPVPEGIKAPETTSHDHYLVKVDFKSGGHRVGAAAAFGLEYKPPVGAISITDAAVLDRPVFDPAEGPGLIEDNNERLICTVRVRADGYDPATEPGRCAVAAHVYDSDDQSHINLYQDFTFDRDGSAWVFLELPNPPALRTEPMKQVRVQAYHGARTTERELIVPYHASFRPDRAPEVVGYRWNTANGSPPSRAWLQAAPSLVLEVLAYHHDELSPIALAIAVLPRFRTNWRLTSDSTRVVSFAAIRTTPTAAPKFNPTVDLPPFPDDLFAFDSFALYVAVQYSFRGVSYAAANEFGEEQLPDQGGPGLLKATLSSTRSSSGSVCPRPAPSLPPGRLSGRQWVARFPDGGNLATLASGFQAKLRRFIAMLEGNGATVRVTATRRPRERAYLMHHAYRISHGFDPARVPSMAGVDIIWSHPRAVEAATDMVEGYEIVYEPALRSRHTDGRAVDMRVRNLPTRIRVPTGTGEQSFDIGARLPENNIALWRIADEHFGIRKSPSDWVHWSEK